MSGKRAVKILVLLVLSVFMAGCDANVFIERYVPKDADEFVRGYIDMLREGDIEEALKALDPESATPEAAGSLREMAAVLSQGEIVSVKLIKFFNRKTLLVDHRRSFLTYHVELDNVWLHMKTFVDRTDGKFTVYGLYVRRLDGDPSEIHTFDLSGKPLYYYLVLLLAVAVPIFTIYTAILCARTRMHRKWRWCALILVGFGSFMLNWTSGLWGLRMLAVWFLGGMVMRDGLDGPWMVYVSVPVGAILFHVRRRTMMKHYEYIERYLARQKEEQEEKKGEKPGEEDSG